jgi:lipoprotein signal peptidase
LVQFIKPTAPKLVFLAQWLAYVLIVWLQGTLDSRHRFLVALYPLALFYLLACVLAHANRRLRQLAPGRPLLALGLALAAIDQGIKLLVTRSLSLGTSVPLLEGWLHLAHERNVQGSWVVNAFNIKFIGLGVLALIAVLTLLCALLGHRYYVATQRQSLWADVAFLGLFAGTAGWIADIVLRGYIVDFIQLPGLVTADLKDIFLSVGVAALLAEALDNPAISLAWQGWRQEIWRLRRTGVSVVRFYHDAIRRKP